MLTLEYFLVARSVSVDQTTNQTSVFEILEDVSAPTFPFLIPGCAAVALWNVEPADMGSDFQSTVRISLPDGQEHQLASNFKTHARRHRVIQRIQGIPITSEGELRFELLLNGAHQAGHTVTIRQAQPIAESLDS